MDTVVIYLMPSEDFKNISGNNDHDREQLENQYDHTKSFKNRKTC